MFKKTFLHFFCFLFAIQSESAIIEYSNSFENVPINFAVGFTVPKFDPNLGTLNKIEFQLTGSFTGSSRAENLSAVPVTIYLSNRVRFKQMVSGGPVLFDEYILKQDSFVAQGWDGSFPPDWNGPSGKEFVFLNEVIETFVVEKTDIASLALFSGVGNVLVPVTAQDASTTSMSGPNIVASQFENMKSVYSLVRYHYTPVPEPQIWGLTAIGICGMVILWKKLIRKN